MKASEAQKERQLHRDEKTGKYTVMNPCELCGKSTGHNYYSDERCNQWGVGLILCEQDAIRLSSMSDDEALSLLNAGVRK